MRAARRFGVALVALGAGLVGSAAQAAGTVSVSFVEPARFRDVRDAHLQSDANLATLRRHIEEAAAPYVADGQALRVEVTDVDLAGEVIHGGPTQPVRVLRGSADWPRIELRYVLEAPGQAPVAGRAQVQDMSYLQRASGLRLGIELPYERRMLDEWFRTALRGPAPN
jgi:Protein of unknown function (DUF3016)